MSRFSLLLLVVSFSLPFCNANAGEQGSRPAVCKIDNRPESKWCYKVYYRNDCNERWRFDCLYRCPCKARERVNHWRRKGYLAKYDKCECRR
jgi:hypothetical protein